MKKQTSLPAEIIKGRKMIYKLAKNDFGQSTPVPIWGSYGIYPAGRDSARLLVCLRGRIQAGENTLPVPFVLYLIAGDRAVVLFFRMG